jgi:hypothetical protein
VVVRLTDELKNEVKPFNQIGDTLVGFENHGGRTYLGEGVQPFAQVDRGNGNNSESGEEGARYKNTFGTYLHGPLLSKNPHFADYLIATALKVDQLQPLNDHLIKKAHVAAQKLR